MPGLGAMITLLNWVIRRCWKLPFTLSFVFCLFDGGSNRWLFFVISLFKLQNECLFSNPKLIFYFFNFNNYQLLDIFQYKTTIAPISSERIELSVAPSRGLGQTHSPLTGSALDHRSTPPEFESRRGHIWRVYYLWRRFITFGGRSAHLGYHVHKSSRKTSIIVIIILTFETVPPLPNLLLFNDPLVPKPTVTITMTAECLLCTVSF